MLPVVKKLIDKSQTISELTKDSQYADEILDLIYHYDELTTSDLQGAVMVLVRKIREGR